MKYWPVNKAYFWERTPFFRLLLPLVAGILCYEYFSLILPVQYDLRILIVAVFVFTFLSFRKQAKALVRAGTFISYFIAFALVGWLCSYFYDIKNDAEWFGNKINASDGFIAEIIADPVEKEKTIALHVKVVGAVSGDTIYPTVGNAYLYIYKYDAPAYEEGDRILIPDNWHQIKNSGNPYEFDYTAYTARKNIHYRQFLPAKDITVLRYADERSLPFVKRVHNYCVEQLEYYIYDRHTLALLEAMLMGERELLDLELKDAYSETGIVHVIAISGAHIAVFFIVISFLFSLLRIKRYPWLKYIAALPFIWLYVVIAGAPPSAVRAATMFTILGIGYALQKNPNGYNQLYASAFVLLCINPMWLFDVGFQLSFLAVLSILVFYNPIANLYRPTSKILSLIWSSISVSIAAEILVAPLVVYYFHNFPLYFIFANVLAYVLMSTVLMSGMVLLLFVQFPPVGLFISDALILLTSVFNKAIFTLQYFNPDALQHLYLSGIQLVVLYLIVGAFTYFLLKKNKPSLYIGLSAVIIFLSLLLKREWDIHHRQQVVIYNIGRTDYIEIISGDTYTAINPVEISSNDYEYSIKPAHIAWGVQHRADTVVRSNHINIGSKRLLIVSKALPDTTLKADYVYIKNAAGIDMLERAISLYTPSICILGNNISQNKAERMQKYLHPNSIKSHHIKTDGAFILESD